jgi:hypothetical protein
MLKFSGYPYLIRGQPEKCGPHRARRTPGRVPRGSLHPGPHGARPLSLGSARPGTAAGPNGKPGLRVDNDARTGMPFGIPKGAMCVQRFDDSRNSAIRITYRISLRSSSMPEPRDPLLKVLSYYSLLRRHDGEDLGGGATGGRGPETGIPDGPTGGRARQSNVVE